MTENQMEKERKELVVQSNELVRKQRLTLTITEQRIILYVISKIKPDVRQNTYRFDIKDFCKIVGIEYKNSLTYIKRSLKGLRDKSCWIVDEKEEWTFAWLNEIHIKKDCGIVELSIGDRTMDYLTNLKSNFTQYQLYAILALRSSFSIRLYEILKSYEYKGYCDLSLEELKRQMINEKPNEDKYKKANDFRRFAIDKSLKEINTYTDIEVDYEVIKTGRSITGFHFTINKPDFWNGEYSATKLYLEGKIPHISKRDKELSKEMEELKNQMSLWEDE